MTEITAECRGTKESLMESTKILPITKQQSRSLNDRKASRLYSKRLLIDQSVDESRVMKQLREVWE